MRISKNQKDPNKESERKLVIIPATKGINRATSTSKIRNKTANKKNRSEKGRRPDSLGSNPHSNGLNFSKERTVLNLKVKQANLKIIIKVITAKT